LQLLQSDACYESRVLWPRVRDVPLSRDVHFRDALPLHRDAGRHEYDVLMPYDDVPQLSSTFCFLQMGFCPSRIPEFIVKTEHRWEALVPGYDVARALTSASGT
jgi:hypothetical protein